MVAFRSLVGLEGGENEVDVSMNLGADLEWTDGQIGVNLEAICNQLLFFGGPGYDLAPILASRDQIPGPLGPILTPLGPHGGPMLEAVGCPWAFVERSKRPFGACV